MSRVVFGLASYEGAEHVAETLESLLAQRHDVAVVVVDDASSDATAEVAARYAARDPRVSVEVNRERTGMVANWRRAFELARERHPDMELFAWASDHDVWHPRWTETLVEALAANPDAVLAYCDNVRISGTGEELKPWTEQADGGLRVRRRWRFDTTGVAGPARRLTLATRRMSAGNMVYGLWRADALERAGVFEPVLAPDRLVLASAAVLGTFVHVPQTLWYRRFRAGVSSERQQRALFAGEPGRHGRLPWWLSHSLALRKRFGLRFGALHLAVAAPYWLWRRAAHEGRVLRKKILKKRPRAMLRSAR